MFAVPVHTSDRSCLGKFTHPVPGWVYALGACLDGQGFFAQFHHASYARMFAELNKDIVFQVARAAWDVSINIFPKQDE